MSSRDVLIKEGELFYGWVIVATCLLITTVSFGSGYTFGVFLMPLRDTFGWTSAATSAAYSVCIFCYTSLSILAGWGVDKFGPRITTVIGGIIIVSGLVLTSQIQSIWQFYITYSLIGIGMSCAYTPLMTTVSRWFLRQRGLAIGIIGSGINAGPMITAPIASYLLSSYGWRFSFLVMGCAAGIVIPAALLLRKSPRIPKETPQVEIESEDTLNTVSITAKKDYQTVDFSLREAIQTRAFWLLSMMFFSVGFGLQMLLVHIVAFSQVKGLTPIGAAIVLSTIAFGSIIGRIVMGATSDHLGRKSALAISTSLEGAIIIWLIGTSSPWMIIILAAVFGFGSGGHGSQFPAIFGEFFGLRDMGAILGVGAFFWGLGGAIGAVLAGHVFDITGSYSSAFAVGAAAMLITVIATFFLKRPVKIE